MNSKMPIIRLLTTMVLTSLFLASCQKDLHQVVHPLSESDNATGIWQWFDLDNVVCRDGSASGIAVRTGAQEHKWVLYLMGGGACFSPSTCSANRSNFTAADFTLQMIAGAYDQGILNPERPENPVGDWNIAIIPYCTGDVHSGNVEESYGFGLSEPQKYMGYRNFRNILQWLAPYWERTGVDEVLLAGISAGGYGTHLSYWSLKELFPTMQAHVINDSGPIFSDSGIYPPCFQLGLQFVFNMPLPDALNNCCDPSYGLADLYTLSTATFPGDHFGLSSYLEDDVIRFFHTPAQNDCAGGEVSGQDFSSALFQLKEEVLMPAGQISTFFAPGNRHTFIQSNDRFYEEAVSGRFYYQWLEDVLEGTVSHVE